MRRELITPLTAYRWPLLSDVSGLSALSLDGHQLQIDYLDPFTLDAVTRRCCFHLFTLVMSYTVFLPGEGVLS